ncbi:hypothetical protein TIFTF001_033824 [Ficus carica]|uniref:Uncharacterized protein n=1 Tax=Ficus carica TaxID=3494 RepID=A0AA88DZ89_FICCA|nr:hypothetical protein TIFTF001_033824 [Ficus carica]
MDTDSFGKCMVLDGCFMIELFRRNMEPSEFNKDIWRDMIFNIRWMKPRLARDMLLFENQIPIFVLHRLFELTEERPSTVEFVKLALQYFQFSGRPIAYDRHLIGRLDDIPHLLGLVYNALVSKTAQQPNNEPKTCKPIKSAVALKEAGVKFVKAKNDAVFHDIGFSSIKGELSIPELVIDENTESLFRNLVAYEQYSKHYSLHRVVDYLQVMDCLVNSDKDVELLRHCEIIDNRVGDDVKISKMFNNLCSGVYFDRTEFYYAQMFDNVNRYCKNPWNTRIATLKNDYFGSPWSIISFVAAVLLLLFTALQTVYTVSSYYQPKSRG